MRGAWWTWRVINKLQVVDSYHPELFSRGLPLQVCLHQDLPSEITCQGYWPFRPEEVRFAVVPRRCILDLRYQFWGQLTLQTQSAVIQVFTRAFSRARLATVLQRLAWPELK
jgi:hypothetical protein